MSKERQNEMTFDGVQQFLLDIGFDQPVPINSSLLFHHHESDTFIILSIPDDEYTVRPADVLSVAMRLDGQGLVGAAALDQFKSGKLPMAS